MAFLLSLTLLRAALLGRALGFGELGAVEADCFPVGCGVGHAPVVSRLLDGFGLGLVLPHCRRRGKRGSTGDRSGLEHFQLRGKRLDTLPVLFAGLGYLVLDHLGDGVLRQGLVTFLRLGSRRGLWFDALGGVLLCIAGERVAHA